MNEIVLQSDQRSAVDIETVGPERVVIGGIMLTLAEPGDAGAACGSASTATVKVRGASGGAV